MQIGKIPGIKIMYMSRVLKLHTLEAENKFNLPNFYCIIAKDGIVSLCWIPGKSLLQILNEKVG